MSCWCPGRGALLGHRLKESVFRRRYDEKDFGVERCCHGESARDRPHALFQVEECTVLRAKIVDDPLIHTNLVTAAFKHTMSSGQNSSF